MRTIDWIGAGIGSIFSDGFLTYLSSVSIGTGSAVSFGTLPVLLGALGVVFVGYGVVKDFLLSKIEKAQASEPA